ncbi:MAG: lytic murein transglycosylase [Nocardioidaceae bacterium]|nr:lytic murein transglycosylase [Nocardioidaceae bacterium]
MTTEADAARDHTLRVVLAALLVVGVLLGLVVFAVLRFGGGVAGAESFTTYQPAPAPAALPPVRTQEPSRSANRQVLVDPAWVSTVAAKAGIPAPALRAYADSEIRLSREKPGCHLGWNTLAGIGWIESQHGTLGGRTLREDGYSLPTTILGPALDGQRFAAIRSTPSSARWHGDTVWEHAVGPLQFLSSTWDRWGADGDGDGKADPRDLDDAALAAGRYLCADAHDLATDAGWSRAVHSYNHDDQYVVNVAGAASSYASRAR